MGVNKVEYGSNTLVDLTSDTVTPESLLRGVTAHDAAGNQIVGTGSGGGGGSMEDTEDLIKRTVGWVGKNIFSISDDYSSSRYGLTITMDSTAGTVTLNGTASSDINTYLWFETDGRTYFISKAYTPSELGWDLSTNYKIVVENASSDVYFRLLDYSSGTVYLDVSDSNPIEFTFEDLGVTSSTKLIPYIYIAKNVAFNNVVMKLMITESQYTDEFEPKHPPATEYFPRLVVCETEAEWNAMSDEEKNDPYIYWVRPWATSDIYASDKTPIGTVVSVTTAKTGEVSGISTPTGNFPTKDYLVCNNQQVELSEYPDLAEHFKTVYGSATYFGGSGTKFSMPNFSADYPTNGILCIKARISSDIVSMSELKDTATSKESSWSSEKINAELLELYETIQILIEDKTYLTSVRSKNLGTKPTTEQMTKLANGDLTWAHNGDYWNDGTYLWEVLDNTLYLNRRGNPDYEKPHLIIKSRSNLIRNEAYLISADGLTKGYAECAYRTRTDGKGRAQCKTIINNWLSGTNGQIASHYELMSAANDASGATAWRWQAADVELESEVNVTGHINWGVTKYSNLTSNGKFNIGTQWGQFMLYRLAPYRAINRSENRWLRDLVGLNGTVPAFSVMRNNGNVDPGDASYAGHGISPFFGLEAKS